MKEEIQRKLKQANDGYPDSLYLIIDEMDSCTAKGRLGMALSRLTDNIDDFQEIKEELLEVCEWAFDRQ